jgi:hypothetical protein
MRSVGSSWASRVLVLGARLRREEVLCFRRSGSVSSVGVPGDSGKRLAAPPFRPTAGCGSLIVATAVGRRARTRS